MVHHKIAPTHIC